MPAHLFIDALCARVLTHADEIAQATITEIYRDYPTYKLKSTADMVHSIRNEIRAVLGGLATRRIPGQPEQRNSFQLGHRNAELGSPGHCCASWPARVRVPDRPPQTVTASRSSRIA
jgi:hypothetical protein